MSEYLIKRPIAVSMFFLALAILGVMSFFFMPVSLMPDVDVPSLRIETTYPEGNPLFIEQSILRPLRQSFQGMYGIDQIESIAGPGTGQINLTFLYGTDMKLAFIDANEKIDQSLALLPIDIVRPLVRRVLSTDIPIARLQVYSDHHTMLELSDLCTFVVRRRLEQIKGVSLVEQNGGVRRVYRLTPNPIKMAVHNVTEQHLIQAVNQSNAFVSQVKVREGIYEYDVAFDHLLANPDNLKDVPVKTPAGQIVPLWEFAEMEQSVSRPVGSHFFNDKQGIVFAVHKQSSANFNDVGNSLRDIVELLRDEHINVSFELTQDQSALLSDSMGQLSASLVLGTFLAVIILFAFSAEWKSPTLMGVIIPISLLIALSAMYLAGLSINIITLSGLILGIGILIDNGIIIIDNMTAKQQAGNNLSIAAVNGSAELAPALLSSTLTTLCVFIPLIGQAGLAGSFFKEQAIALSIVLFASLMVSFFLLPVLYHLIRPSVTAIDSRFYTSILTSYKNSQHPNISKKVVSAFFLVAILGAWSWWQLEVQNLPDVRTNDIRLHIEWDEPLNLNENVSRVARLVGKSNCRTWEADIGKSDIMEDEFNVVQQALIYLSFDNYREKQQAISALQSELSARYPSALYTINRGKNPYDQLFGKEIPYLILKIRTANESMINPAQLGLDPEGQLVLGRGFQNQSGLQVHFETTKMAQFGLNEEQLINKIKTYFNDQQVSEINTLSQRIPVLIRGKEQLRKDELDKLTVNVSDSTGYPLSYFIRFQAQETPMYVTADATGVYQHVEAEKFQLQSTLDYFYDLALQHNWLITKGGRVMQEQQNLKGLLWSLTLAIVLLYIILAAQFESFRIPFVILAEIPISTSGSLFLLYISGSSINISSLLGIIIMLGIVVNDSILKTDTINRNRKAGMKLNEAIREAGSLRLKPILMTSITTVLALTPLIFGGGIGSDVQKPLAIAVTGGLIVGTLCSIYLVPVIYKLLVKK